MLAIVEWISIGYLLEKLFLYCRGHLHAQGWTLSSSLATTVLAISLKKLTLYTVENVSAGVDPRIHIGAVSHIGYPLKKLTF
jgi:hypothetical protein